MRATMLFLIMLISVNGASASNTISWVRIHTPEAGEYQALVTDISLDVTSASGNRPKTGRFPDGDSNREALAWAQGRASVVGPVPIFSQGRNVRNQLPQAAALVGDEEQFVVR